jgi:hypothetical protein
MRLRRQHFLAETGELVVVDLDRPGNPFPHIHVEFSEEEDIFLYIQMPLVDESDLVWGVYRTSWLDDPDHDRGYHADHGLDGRLRLDNQSQTREFYLADATVKAIVAWAKAGGHDITPHTGPRNRLSVLAG